MLNSSQLQAAFDADSGTKLHLEASINLNSRFLDESVSVSVLAGGDYFGSKDQAFNDRLGAPFKRWVWGESKYGDEHGLMDGEVECGQTSEEISGAGGDLSTPPSIEISYSTRTVYHIRIYGDEAWNDYPVDFTVELFYGGAYHTEISITGNDNVDYFYTLPTERAGVTKAKLTITKWSEETRPCKIYEFFTGEIIMLNEDDIYSAYLLEEDSYQSNSLPVGKTSSNQISLSFYDDGSIQNSKMKRNKLISLRVSAENNGVLYPVDMGNYYSKEWQRDTLNDMFSVIGLDMLSITAEDQYYATVAKNQTAYDVLLSIMTASRIPAYMFYIDPNFVDYDIPVALMPLTSQQKAIDKVMEMTLGSCYYDRKSGRALMLAPSSAASAGISQKTYTNLDHVMEGTYEPVELNEIATVFEIKYYEMVITSSPENVIESTEEINIEGGLTEEIILDFPKDYVSVDEVSTPVITQSDTGLSVLSWTAYVGYISIMITNSSINAQTITSITVSGKPVTAISHKYSTEDAEAIESYGRIVFEMDNQLVQSYARAKAIGDELKDKSVEPGGKIVSNLWGAPYAHIGDTVTVPDKAEDEQITQIKRQEFNIDESDFMHTVTSKKVS